MRYLMFVVEDPARTDEDRSAAPEVEEFFDYVRAKGGWELAARLQPVESATTVRVQAGELLVTDGPFTESKEWIHGVAIFEAFDLDDAIEIASRNPHAYLGRIELRPIHSMGGLDD